MMHTNRQLLKNLFDHLNASDHQRMAECYHNNATFHDIAFDLAGKSQIHAMWRMICTPDQKGRTTGIQVELETFEANDATGSAVIVDDYTFRLTGERVRNKIESKFKFADGKIIEHIDECDDSGWAVQAYRGIWIVPGLFLGRIEAIRRFSAMRKLRKFDPSAFQG